MRDHAPPVRLVPFVNSTDLEAQVKIAFGDTAQTPLEEALEEAHQVIERQGLQIVALDELVRQLQAEKMVLEDQLRQYGGTGHFRHHAVPSNPLSTTPTRHITSSTIITTPTRPLVASQGHHTAPAMLHTRPTGNSPLLYRSTGRVPAPSNHFPSPSQRSISNVPSTSQHTVRNVPPPLRQESARKVSPLKVLGSFTAETFNDLRIADHHHNSVCNIVELIHPENWQSSLLDMGVTDTDGVCELIKAMELDVQTLER